MILTFLFCPAKIMAQEKSAVQSINRFPSGPIEIVETGKFKFVADRAYPTGGGSGVVMTARANEVQLDSMHAVGNLAFFGTNTSAPFNNNSGGIEFDGEVSRLKIKKNKKETQLTLSFSIAGIRDSYRCIFTITDSGPSNLNVSSNKKSPISYKGYIYMLPEE